MICFNCGNDASGEDYCPVCGANMVVYRRVLSAADEAYNEGLARAQIRDLTGALISLHRSLRLNKFHIQARNLLGLVYFEMGQTVLALREWIVSKNLAPEDNIVDEYLEKIQRPGVLNRLDGVAQKYNQALEYCRQGSRDLARIQLKRIVGANPKMVEAHQLLGLVLIADGKFEQAHRVLLAASKVDSKNPVTMKYLEEVRRELKLSGKKRRRKRKPKPEENEYAMTAAAAGNSRPALLDLLENNGSGMLNILIGAGLGVLIAMFLIVPTMRQNDNSRAQKALVSANKEAVNSANTVSSLEKEVDSLQKELKQYTGKGDMQTSYEKLLEAQRAQEEGDTQAAAQALNMVNEKLLDVRGKEIYGDVSLVVREGEAKEAYAAGSAAFRSRKYAEAIEPLLVAVKYDPKYSDGYALYYLAGAYENTEDTKNAGKYYAQFAQLFPRTNRGSVARKKAEEFGADLEKAAQELQEAQEGANAGNGETGTRTTNSSAAGETGTRTTNSSATGDTGTQTTNSSVAGGTDSQTTNTSAAGGTDAQATNASAGDAGTQATSTPAAGGADTQTTNAAAAGEAGTQTTNAPAAGGTGTQTTDAAATEAAPADGGAATPAPAAGEQATDTGTQP